LSTPCLQNKNPAYNPLLFCSLAEPGYQTRTRKKLIMPRARSSYPSEWQTAAPTQETGCLTGFLIPPMAVLVVGLLMAFFVKGLNIPVQAGGLPPAALGIVTPVAPAVSGQVGNSSLAVAVANEPAALPSSSSLAPIFTPEIHYWAESIVRWAAAANVDPNLAAVVMQIESCGDPRATSRSGAMGLFQVMPFHFTAGEQPYEPDTNALRGLGYLRRSLDKAGGNARLALAGYNGGIGVINRGEWSWAAETARYVKYGYPIYQDALGGASTSATLNEWYGRYGAGLCRQAAQRLGLH
jgi:soluble lytic murein transglycosylase-like protein